MGMHRVKEPQTHAPHWDAWFGTGEYAPDKPKSRQAALVGDRGAGKKRPQHTIDMVAHEWAALGEDAGAHGLSRPKFLVLLWRNWRLKRASLSVIPELAKEPWKRTA